MKPIDEDAELDLRCALADNKQCVFTKFLISQKWVPAQCPNKALAKKLFYKILRDQAHEAYEKEYPE
jgi:hypothetical protein